MNNLTKEQKASFAAKNALVGLGPTEYTAQLSEEKLASLPATLVFSSNADESHFPPHYVAIYQSLVLDEPSSSVSQVLKEAFLALRRAAETDR